jgi:transposase-like protein
MRGVPPQANRMVQGFFVLGLSPRKVNEVLLPIVGRPIGPATVSTVVEQFHAGVSWLSCAVPADQHRCYWRVPVAFGSRRDGKKEVIDPRLAQSESAGEWERFFRDLIRRSLRGGSR